MNIQEATKLAMEKGKPIYRSSEFETFRKPGDNLELLPTNSYGYVVVKPRQKSFYPLWQPMAEDLLADDWHVVGEKTMTEKIKGLEVDLEIQENKQTPTKKQ